LDHSESSASFRYFVGRAARLPGGRNHPTEYQMPTSHAKTIDDVPSSNRKNETPQTPTVSTARIRSLGVGLVMAGAAASGLAADRTVSVKEAVNVAAPPSQTWEKIKDFNSWQAWHPAFASTEIIKGRGNTKGTVRVLTTKDGVKFTEELVLHDAASHTYSYRITESPLPITDYVSKLEVREIKGGSNVVWSSNFYVKDGASEEEIKKVISGVYRAGLDNLGSVIK
jgi:Polyketide cyclase / dehydrase and lipid transport